MNPLKNELAEIAKICNKFECQQIFFVAQQCQTHDQAKAVIQSLFVMVVVNSF